MSYHANANPQNPLFLAREAQEMAKNARGSSSEMFQTVALISMCVVAASAGAQVLMQLYRELNRPERGQGRGR